MPEQRYGGSIFKIIGEKQVVAPFVRSAILQQSWPTTVNIPDPYFHESHSDGYFHPSVHSLHGELAVYRQLQGLKEELDYTRLMTPLMGTVYHVIIQQNLINAGLVTPEEVEVALVDEERHWKGHADLMFRGELCDIKSMNSKAFEFNQSPYPSWRYQLHPYMDRLNLETSLVLVVEQGMPWRMREYRIDRDEKVLTEIYTKWERVSEALEEGVEPQTCCKPENSRYCPANCEGRIPPTY